MREVIAGLGAVRVDHEKQEAKKRQQVTQAKPGEGKVGGGNLSTTETTTGKSRDKVGERVGAG